MQPTYSRRAFNMRWCALLGVTVGANSTLHARTADPPPVGIDAQFDESLLGSVEVPVTQVADLNQAGLSAQAGLNGAATVPGYSPAAGLAGMVIGLGIVRHIEDASIRKKTNAPIEPLRAVYAAHWRELGFQDELWRVWDAHGAPEQRRCSPDSARKCVQHLTLQPAITLLSNARILCISIEAKLKDKRAARHLKVTFLSAPVALTQMDQINDYWSKESLRAIAAVWSEAVTALVPILQAEIALPGKPAQQPTQAIRFINAAGIFYDRGTILTHAGQRLVYRALDGNITSAYLDRTLTTEEYYDWLAGKPMQAAAQ